jgi:hypothetical protein
MNEYLGLPAGDTLIPDYKFDLSAIVNGRFITARTDSIYAYYSPEYVFNIFSYLNELILQDQPNALIPINDDLLILSDIRGERMRVLEDGTILTVDDNVEYGCYNQNSWTKTAADEVYLASLSGAWKITNHGYDRISGPVQEDFDTLTADEKEHSRVFYNQLKRQVWFSFSDTKIFIYDIEMQAWITATTNFTPVAGVVNHSGHMILANSDDFFNFDYSRSEVAADNEALTTNITLKVVSSALINKKVSWRRILINFKMVTGSSSMPSVVVTVDGVSQTYIPNARGEVYIRQVGQEAVFEINADVGIEYINGIQVEYEELRR